MLEIIDVEKRQREMTVNIVLQVALRAVALEQGVDAMFDHSPGRQARQFVIIGRAEQRVFERFLLGDVGGAGEQQIAFRDPGGPVRGEKYMFGRTGGHGLLQHGGTAAAQQFKAGLVAVAQLRRRCRGHLEQRGGGIVHQQEIAVLVLNCHAGRKQSEDIPQDAQFGIKIAFITGLRLGRLKVMFIGTVHGSGA